MSERLDDIAVFERHVRAAAIVDKVDTAMALARGRSVLDIGCIDHSRETAISLGDRWLHRRLKDVAGELVGLDMLEEDAKLLAEDGFRIEVGDAEDFDLGRTFDVIVAGDIIEHLANPGRFLECARRHLGDGGQLLITTPNPFNVEQVALIARSGQVSVNFQHVLWLDPITAHHLLRRTGFSIQQFHWAETRFAFPVFERPRLRALALRAAAFLGRRRAMWRRDLLIVAVPDRT